MSVFSRIRGFLSRHRNKFIVGGVIITGSIFLTRYAQQKLKDWQERETREFLEKTRKQHHFESIGRTCNQTILNLSSALFDVILQLINTEEIINTLKTNPDNKMELWNDLKVLVIVKAACMIYSIVLLVVILRIQLSIVGGYLYKDPNSVTTEMQEKYLSLYQNFLNNGIHDMTKLLKTEVSRILEGVDLKKQLRLSDLEAILWSIQTTICTNDGNPIDKLRQTVISGDIPNSKDVYCNILRDTADFLDSDEVKSLTTHCVNRGFILLGDKLSEFYTQNGKTTETSEQFHNPFEKKKPLAKLLPIINGLLSKQSLPQQFVQQLVTNEKLQNLGANVYESLL